MADEKTTFELDLDNKSFVDKINEASGVLAKFGQGGELSGLLGIVKSFVPELALVTAAFYGVKKALDFTLEAEKLNQINYQFEQLTANAGLSSTALINGLEKSSHGLIDNTDLMKLANKAIVELGTNAKKLPEIMELARKVTAVFGGELENNFENLNMAISMGNQRMLKHMGIKIDVAQAERNYAESIGKTTTELTAQDKQTALLNASIEKGKKSFATVNDSIMEANNTWKQLGITIKEIGELFLQLFEKYIGPSVKLILHSLNSVASYFKNTLVAAFGDGAAQAGAKINILKGHIESLEQQLKIARSSPLSIFNKGVIEADTLRLEKMKKELQELEAQKKSATGGAKGAASDPEEERKAAELTLKYHQEAEKEIDKLRKERLASQQKNIQTQEEAESMLAAQKMQLAKEYDDKINEIELKRQQNLINRVDAENMEVELLRTKNEKLAEMDEELASRRIAASERYAEHAQNDAEGISRGWDASATRINNDNKALADIGKKTFSAVQHNASDAFKAMGNGSKSAGEAMRGFFYGALGDMADAAGQFHLAKGLASMNPIEIAEGGVLIALGAALKAQSGGSSAGAGGGGGGGSAGGGEGTSSTPQPAQKKTLSVNIQGNYFETEQTRTRLMEMMRETSDATDFNLTKVGG